MINMEATVRLRKDLPSATIIISRGQRRNALSKTMIQQVREALEDFQQEKSIRAIILTGSGDYFSSGTDLQELATELKQDSNGLIQPEVMQQWHEDIQAMNELLETMLRLPKPIIAAVNGPALGFAAALVLAADMVVATRTATLAWPETRWGLAPGLSAPLLSRRVGPRRAAQLLLGGEAIESDQGLQLGLIDQVVDDSLLWAHCQEMAKRSAALSPIATSITKRLLNETIGESLFPELAVGAANTAASRTTLDAVEGIQAFVQKRSPQWP